MISGPRGRTACDNVVERASVMHRLLDRVHPVVLRDLGRVEAAQVDDKVAGARLTMQMRIGTEEIARVYLQQDDSRTLIVTSAEAELPPPLPDDADTCAFCFGPSGPDRLQRHDDEAVMCAKCVTVAKQVLSR